MNPPPLRKLLESCALLFFSLAGCCGASWFDWNSQKIMIVQGTSSLTEASEKPLAARLARQFDTWLTEAGAPHKMLTDNEVSSWSLWRTRVVILPYNPHPSPLELKTFQSVIRSGGMLLVCYGMDQPLASLMEVKLGPYQTAKSKDQWASFEFDRTTLPGLPDRVFQSTQNLVPALPNSGTAHVIANWMDTRGARTPEAAWIQSKAGFWMTHILQTGDDENKRQMLLAMLATVIPDLWSEATEYRLSPRRPFGGYDSLESAYRALRPNPPPLFIKGKEAESYAAAQGWLASLTSLYTQRNLTNTFSMRGVWLAEEACSPPESWPLIETHLQCQKLNTVFFHVGNPLTLRPASQLLPASVIATRLLDKTAAPTLHAWLSCMNLEGATPEQLKPLREQNRLQVSDTGETLNWLCPSHPDNRALLAETVSQLAQDKLFSGIHLDYIRYPNSRACFCSGCRQRFEQSLGRPILRWPEAARSGSLTQAYQRWRADQISACVNAMGKAIHTADSTLQISAAVYGATPTCFASVGQDWPDWLHRDSINFVCPMNYTADLKAFQTLLKTQATLNHANRIFPGVGLCTSQSQLSPDQAAAQLMMIQNAGFPGFVLFEYNRSMLTTKAPFLPERSQEPEFRSQK